MYPVYDFDSSYADILYELEEMAMGIGIAFLAIFAVLGVLGLVSYIFQSIALTRVGRRRGIKCAWLIWIPIANSWALGALADEYDARQGLKRRFRVLLLAVLLIFIVAYIVMFCSISAIEPLVENIESYDIDEIFSVLMKLVIGVYSFAIGISFIGIIYSALTYICIYKIFESLSPKRCVLHFILSIFIPLYTGICLFCLRNRGWPYPEETPTLPEAREPEKGWYDA